jgi:hypothetical protein
MKQPKTSFLDVGSRVIMYIITEEEKQGGISILWNPTKFMLEKFYSTR